MTLKQRKHLIDVNDLCVQYRQADLSALDCVSMTIHQGEAVALVGDSGCGKTTLALAIMRLLPRDAIVRGSAMLYDREGARPIDIMQTNARDICAVRGSRIAMVFQNPSHSLNPVMRVGPQIEEVLHICARLPKADARRETLELLKRVGLTDPVRIRRSFPHELSGGMAQRVMLAIALAGKPDLLIADEPTSSLDLNIQAQIVELLRELRRETGMSILLITHDMGIARALADRVCVMDANRIVEDRPFAELKSSNVHDATRKLMDASDRKRRRMAHSLGDLR